MMATMTAAPPFAAATTAPAGIGAALQRAAIDTAAVLSVRGLVKRYGGLVVTQDVDLDLRRGEVHAIVGPNGAGKTTLLGQLTGDVRSDAGRIYFGTRDITALPVHRRARLGIGRSFQITSVFPDLTVLENALLAVHAHDGHSFRFWQRALDDARHVATAQALLAQVGLADQSGRIAAR
jgi:branched-chain amino acid transport system ATP-binding protein